MQINKWVTEARARAKLTQQQLADALGVTKSNVSAWENSRHEPSWSQMLKIRAMTGAPLPTEGDPGPHESDWPFSFPRSQLDQLTPKQLAELEKVIAAAVAIAADGRAQMAPFSLSGSVGEPEKAGVRTRKAG